MPAARSVGRFDIALAICAVLGLLAIIVYDEHLGWVSKVKEVEMNLTQTSKAVIQHVDDTIQMTGATLDALVTAAEVDEREGHGNQRLVALMTRLARLSGRIDSFIFIGPDGRALASSKQEIDPAVDLSDREYFRYHRDSRNTRAYVGAPVNSRFGDGWVLTVSRRYERPDGSFGGVVAAALPLSYLSEFFSNFYVGEGGSFLLVRGDGMVLAREPYREEMPGMDISSHALFTRYLARSDSDFYEYDSPIDGQQRFGAYTRSPLTGTVILTAASRQETVEEWRQGARIRWLSFLFVFSLAGYAAWRWLQQARLRRAREMELAAREAEFRLLSESSADMIQRLDAQGVQQYVSPACVDLLGVAPARLVGRNVVEGLDEENAARVGVALHKLRMGSRSETVVLRRDLSGGRAVWLQVAFSRMPAAAHGAGGIVAITRDITRQKHEQDELDLLANTDALTGLANRRAFDTRLRQMTEGAAGRDAPAALLMVDADRFKLFNDTYGHAEGDRCLKAIAGAVMQCRTHAGDCAARFGGEEIAVLLPDTGPEAATAVAEAIRARVAGLGIEHRANEPWGKVTVSVGVAMLAPGAHGAPAAEALFQRADKALYRAKEGGRNRVVGETPTRAGGVLRRRAN